MSDEKERNVSVEIHGHFFFYYVFVKSCLWQIL